MDATIVNLGTTSPDEDVFLCGPRVHLVAGASVIWPGLHISDLDGDEQLKGLITAGKVSVSIALTASDAASPLQGSLSPQKLPRYTVALLPTGANAVEGQVAFATNGRRTGQGGGAGTGVPVYWSNAAWRVFFDDTAVAA